MTTAVTSPKQLHNFSERSKALVALGLLMDWSVRFGGKNRTDLVVMRAPEPHADVTVNVTKENLNHNRLSSMTKRILRYSHPARADGVLDPDLDLTTLDPSMQGVAAFMTMQFVDMVRDELAQAVSEPEPVKPEPTYTDTPYLDTQGRPIPGVMVRTWPDGSVEYVCDEHNFVTDNKMAVAGHRKAHSGENATTSFLRESERIKDLLSGEWEVSRKPWLARRGGKDHGQGRMYESQRVEEVRYPRATYYRCVGCGALSENPRSVAQHAGRTHPEIPTGADAYVHVTDYQASGITHDRKESAAQRLAREIEAALEGLPFSWHDFALTSEDLAEALAASIVSARPHPTELDEPRELTADEVLDRVRRLVDQGSTQRLHQQVEDLTAQVLAAQEEAAACAARAERAEGNLDALRDLLKEE